MITAKEVREKAEPIYKKYHTDTSLTQKVREDYWWSIAEPDLDKMLRSEKNYLFYPYFTFDIESYYNKAMNQRVNLDNEKEFFWYAGTYYDMAQFYKSKLEIYGFKVEFANNYKRLYIYYN